MTKKTKKAIEIENGNPIQITGSFDFEAAFNNWKDRCESYSTSAISPKPPEAKNPKKKFVPKDLYQQVRNHVTASVARPDSPNDGNSGIYKTLKEIDEEISKKSIFTVLDKKILENFADVLEAFLNHPSLNPQNIVFMRPTKWRGTGEKLFIVNPDKKKIFGHYLDKYFVAKYPKLNKPSGWQSWSSEQENTATPPLYQAIYGGKMFDKGLLEIIREALRQIENPIVPTLRKVKSDALAQIPSVKSWVIKNSKKFYKNNKYDISGFRSALNSQSFVGKETLLFKRLITAAITGKKLSSINANNVYASPISEFRIELLSNSAMANLIKNSYVRSPRAKNPASVKLEKSWLVGILR